MSDTASSQPCKGVSWTIDTWGNLTDQTQTNGTCLGLHVGVGTSNRLGSPYQYDSAGNMTTDGTHTYTYDAEGRVIKVDNGSTATYTYDAEGNRVLNTSSGTQGYISGIDGKVIADVSSTGNWNTCYVYAGGGLVAQYRDSTTYSILGDHLGSARLITKLDKSVYDSLDFMPFGAQIAGGSGTTYKFTGDARDSESNLDHTFFPQVLLRRQSLDHSRPRRPRQCFNWRSPILEPLRLRQEQSNESHRPLRPLVFRRRGGEGHTMPTVQPRERRKWLVGPIRTICPDGHTSGNSDGGLGSVCARFRRLPHHC